MGHRSLTTKPTYALGIWRRLMTVLGRLDSTEAGYLLRVEKFKHVSCLWKWSRRWTDKSRCMHWHRSIYTRLWWSSEALNGVSASLLRRLLPWPGPRQSVRDRVCNSESSGRHCKLRQISWHKKGDCASSSALCICCPAYKGQGWLCVAGYMAQDPSS